jgi:MFS family permease
LGFGFSRTFPQAIFCRTLGGALNGNIGVMRTMVSEIVQEKKSIYQVLDVVILLTSDFRYQSRAFLLFPMCFNIGVIIGPILGGLLADPAGSYPKIFGHNKFLQTF